MNALKCDACGRFVPLADLDSGKASHRMITPESDFSFEEFETLCSVCRDRQEDND